MKTMTIAAALLLVSAAHAADRKPAPEGAKAYIVYPHNGTRVDGGKVWVRMGLTEEMGVAPAGVAKDGTGHHHLLVDADIDDLNLDEEIPNDKQHLHFGGGQTEARLENLAPGKHTLQMLLGDENHVPHDPPVKSEKITIIVPQ